MIYRQGDPSEGFYLVVNGSVRVDRNNEAESDRVPEPEQFTAGDCFGELDVLADSLRTGTAVAMERLVVVAIDRRNVEVMLDSKPDILRHMLESLEEYLESPSNPTDPKNKVEPS